MYFIKKKKLLYPDYNKETPYHQCRKRIRRKTSFSELMTAIYIGTSGWAYGWNIGHSLDWYVTESQLN